MDKEEERKYVIMKNPENLKVSVTKLPEVIPILEHESFTKYRTDRLQSTSSSSDNATYNHLDLEEFVHHLDEKYCRVLDQEIESEIKTFKDMIEDTNQFIRKEFI